MRIINAIEFAPYDYNKNDHTSPFAVDSTDEEWYNYWKACLADSNLNNLKPITKRSWLVDIDAINDFALNVLSETKLNEDDDEDIEFESLEKALYGGIVIFENDKILLTTNCCGDLSNLEEWEDIFISKKTEWTLLWIGHPFVYYKYNDNYIEFSEQTEENADENTQVNFKVEESYLQKQIKEIREKQNSLIQRLGKILNN